MAEDKRKHILLISVGMSPAVITETVYALNQVKDAPQEIVAITTVKGKEAIMEQLFGEDAVWETMLNECKLKGKVIFDEANIELIPDENKKHSKDIVSDSDNNELADKLLRILRGYTTPDYRISFSIAGGRKSMSAVGALVMSLLGRKEDKMYHILVPNLLMISDLNRVFTTRGILSISLVKKFIPVMMLNCGSAKSRLSGPVTGLMTKAWIRKVILLWLMKSINKKS